MINDFDGWDFEQVKNRIFEINLMLGELDDMRDNAMDRVRELPEWKRFCAYEKKKDDIEAELEIIRERYKGFSDVAEQELTNDILIGF